MCAYFYRRIVTENFDSDELRHLKRIKKIHPEAPEAQPSTAKQGEKIKPDLVLLLSTQQQWEKLATEKTPLPEALVQFSGSLEPQLMQVPKNAPLTREQFTEWSKVWPCAFHEYPRFSFSSFYIIYLGKGNSPTKQFYRRRAYIYDEIYEYRH